MGGHTPGDSGCRARRKHLRDRTRRGRADGGVAQETGAFRGRDRGRAGRRLSVQGIAALAEPLRVIRASAHPRTRPDATPDSGFRGRRGFHLSPGIFLGRSPELQ